MTPSERDSLIEERDFLLTSLKALDSERTRGMLSDEEYTALRDEQTVRAAEVLRALKDSEQVQPGVAGSSARPKKWVFAALAFIGVAALSLVLATGERLPGQSSSGEIAADTNTLLRTARTQAGSGEPAKALKTYDQVLARTPDNVEALTYRGWLIRLAGLPNEGLKSIERAIEINPAYPDARFFRGFIYLRDRSQPSVAIPEFEAFLANDPPAEMIPLVQQALADARAQAAGAAPID